MHALQGASKLKNKSQKNRIKQCNEMLRGFALLLLAVATGVALSQAENCTPPRPAIDSRRPYCIVPDTVSWQAQKLLRTKHVSTDLPPGISAAAVQAMRSSIAAARSSSASIAAATFFERGSVINSTVAGVPVTWGTPVGYDKSKNDDKLVLYFHGGFFMLYNCHDHLNVVGPVAKAAGVKMLCVDYPLTPEHPFPAALDSAMAVLKWVLGQGYKPSNIALLGDSVGGNGVPVLRALCCKGYLLGSWCVKCRHHTSTRHSDPNPNRLKQTWLEELTNCFVVDFYTGNLAMAVLVAAAREGLELPGAVGLMSPRVEMSRHGDTLTTLAGEEKYFVICICFVNSFGF